MTNHCTLLRHLDLQSEIKCCAIGPVLTSHTLAMPRQLIIAPSLGNRPCSYIPHTRYADTTNYCTLLRQEALFLHPALAMPRQLIIAPSLGKRPCSYTSYTLAMPRQLIIAPSLGKRPCSYTLHTRYSETTNYCTLP